MIYYRVSHNQSINQICYTLWPYKPTNIMFKIAHEWSIWYDLIVLAFLKRAFWAMIRFELFLCHGHYTIGRYTYITKYLLIIWCLLPVIIK